MSALATTFLAATTLVGAVGYLSLSRTRRPHDSLGGGVPFAVASVWMVALVILADVLR